jgi:hypothetical protein
MGKVSKRIVNYMDKVEMVKQLYTFSPPLYPIRRKCYITSDLLQNETCKLFRRHSGNSYTIFARLCASLSYSRLRENAHTFDYCAKTLYKIGHERKRSGEDRVGAIFSVQDFPGVVRGIGNGFQFSGFRFQFCSTHRQQDSPAIMDSAAQPTGKAETRTATGMPAHCCVSFHRTLGTAWPAPPMDDRNVDRELSYTTNGIK